MKLCVLLSEGPTFCLPLEDGRQEIEGLRSWEELIASLSNVDVDDLVTFLNENAAHHTKGLLLRWNNDLMQGLEIWKMSV